MPFYSKISFYKKLNPQERDELWGLLNDYEKYRIQLKHQKRVGFGEDKFSITEYGSTHEELSKYTNLKEWDREQYHYQKAHGQTHLDKKYKLYLFGDWCRLIENKKFHSTLFWTLSINASSCQAVGVY